MPRLHFFSAAKGIEHLTIEPNSLEQDLCQAT